MTQAEYDATKYSIDASQKVIITDNAAENWAVGQTQYNSAGGGGTPTGTPNSIASFDGDGNLASTNDITVNDDTPFQISCNTLNLLTVSGGGFNVFTGTAGTINLTSDNITLGGGASTPTLSFEDSIGGTLADSVSAPITISVANTNSLMLDGLPTGTGTDLVIDIGNQVLKKTSSARFKKDIEDFSFDLTGLDKLEVKTFKYKDTDKQAYGLIAEELFEVYPELVHLDEEGLPYSIDYSGLSLPLIQEVQSLRSELKSLREEITVLKEKLQNE